MGRQKANSLLPQILTMITGEDITLIPVDFNDFSSSKVKEEMDGIIVSAPYTKKVIPYLDETDHTALEAGAVNLIVNRAGKLAGYNTDKYAVRDMILANGIDLSGKNTAILGSNDLSKAALCAVTTLGAEAQLIPCSEYGEEADISIDDPGRFACLINTTETGSYPGTDNMPADPSVFENLETVIDLISEPLCTKLCFEAKRKGIKTLGGFELPVRRAFHACRLISGRDTKESVIESCLQQLLSKKRNIVLIGMPTSGKTTVSGILAEKTGREVIEMDAEIEKILGTSIRECFQTKGEFWFRSLETKVAEKFSEGKGRIISCGGGVVKVYETMRLLSMNGLVLWLKRDLSQLFPTDSRPLSGTRDDLGRLYEERLPLYSSCADIPIDNTGDLSDTISSILEIIGKES